jgi:pimeloyl-ACP methyl ester carboxylesterase
MDDDRSAPRLLLLHGLGMSGRVWDRVHLGLLDRCDVLAPTLAGHRGGATVPGRPVRIDDLVDDVERRLDAAGWTRAHVAGNSIGGWVALELARRGRALSVCALSPAGSWHAGTADQAHGVRKIRSAARAARLGRPYGLAVALRSAPVGRFVFRDVARHGDRLGVHEAIAAVDDLLGCAVLDDLLTTREELSLFAALPCPVTLAWSGDDAILPAAVNGAVARDRVPGARFVVLPGVGHVPMLDDPDAVIAVIRETVETALVDE